MKKELSPGKDLVIENPCKINRSRVPESELARTFYISKKKQKWEGNHKVCAAFHLIFYFLKFDS